MKKETLFNAIDAMDSEIVEEALALEGKLRADIRRQRKRRITAVSAIAACLCLVIVINPIASWIKGTKSPGGETGLPVPTIPSFLLSLPGSTVYTDSNEPQQKRFEWHGRTLTLNYKNSHDVWYTDKHFSTYEMDGEENGSITFVKGTDKVHKISTTMNTLSRAVYTEEGLREKANEIVETYSTIDMDVMEYSCTSNMIETSEEESVDGFINSPSVESYTIEYVQKTEIGYTSCHATVEFGVDGSVDVEIFNEDTAKIQRYLGDITQTDIYNIIDDAIYEYRNANPQIESLTSVIGECTLYCKGGNIQAIAPVKLSDGTEASEFYVRVTLCSAFNDYNSGSVPVTKVDGVTLKKILEIIDEMQEIYSTHDGVKLENLDYFYNYFKSCVDEFEKTATKPIDELMDEIVPRTGMKYRDMKAIISSGIVYDTDPDFQNGDFSKVGLSEYLVKYEAIIAAMLIDRLYGMLPSDCISFRADYNIYQRTECYVRVKLDDPEYPDSTFEIAFVMTPSNVMQISSILYMINKSNGSFAIYVTPFEEIRAQLQ